MKKKIISLLLSFTMIMSLTTVTGCFNTPNDSSSSNSSESSNSEVGLGYVNNREEYFYGIQESMQECIAQDPMSSPEMTAKLAGAMGFKSYRFRMENVEVLYKDQSGFPQLNVKVAEEFHRYLDLLAEEGITNILAQNTYFLQVGYDPGIIAYPRPGTDEYLSFMDLVEESYILLAEEFPEITYWQVGNEINTDFYCNPVDGGAAYTLEEKAQIATDLMYYANSGIKQSNPNAALVMPGLANPNPEFCLQAIYENIASGEFPTGDAPTTNTDDYFDVISWHPYNWSDGLTPNYSEDSTFIEMQKLMYQIAIDYGDEGKKVIFTEFGFTNRGTPFNEDYTVEQIEELQKNNLSNALNAIYQYLPFVETVHIFRLFDWDTAVGEDGVESGATEIEAGFGLFTSPGVDETSLGPQPKKIGLELFKLINGSDADTTPLYQFYKGLK